jgi:hypothetical protein
MLKARKANRVLKIPDEKKKTYIALGYTITDMEGNMIHEHVEPSEKLEQAEKEIQDLKAQIASAGATEQAVTPAPETKKTTKASSKAEK